MPYTGVKLTAPEIDFGNGVKKYNSNLWILVVLVIESFLWSGWVKKFPGSLGSINVVTGPCSKQDPVDVITYSK